MPPATITIGQQSPHPLTVNRMGYGTMRLTGSPHIWDEPADRPLALQILREAVAEGVQFLDTADYYGQDVTNRLIAEALYPYPKGLVICTKVGAIRKEDKSWAAYARPEQLAASIDNNHRSPWILPIPGTSRLAHLHDNLAARNLQLTPEDMAYLG